MPKKRIPIKVRVYTPTSTYMKRKYVEEDGSTVIMEKEKAHQIGWKFELQNYSLYRVKILGLFWKIYCDVVYGSPKAISYDYALKKADHPYMDRKTWNKLLDVKALQILGEGVTTKLPPLFWLIFIFSVMSFLALVYMMMRFGMFL